MASPFGYLFPEKQIELPDEIYLNILLVWDFQWFLTPIFTAKIPPGIFSQDCLAINLA